MNYKDIPSNFKNRNGTQTAFPRDVDAIYNSLNILLRTSPGAVPGNPAFGCSLDKYLFEPIDPFIAKMIEETIRYSVALFEKRVKIKTLEVVEDSDYNRILIKIIFIVIGDSSKEEHDYIYKATR